MSSEPILVKRVAPVARRQPHTLSCAFGTRWDDYYWLRDDAREQPEVLAYLAEENAYHDAYMARLSVSQGTLYKELVGRLKPDDSSVPVFDRGYWYYRKYLPGQEHPIYARRYASMDNVEEILLDGNERAKGHSFYELGHFEVSDDNRLLVFSEDTVGRREYTLRFRDLRLALDLPDCLSPVEDDMAWMADNQTVLYVAKHPQTLLGYRVCAHRLGTEPSLDRCVYEQDDDAYYTRVYRSRSRRYVFIASHSTLSSEYRFALADDSHLLFETVMPRSPNHEYHVEDRDEVFLILSNQEAPNFKLMQAPLATLSEPASWTTLLAHQADVLLTGMEVFSSCVVVSERTQATHRLRILADKDVLPRVLDGDHEVATTFFDDTPDYHTQRLRFTSSAPNQPTTTYEIDFFSGELTTLKVQAVLGGFDSSRYATARVWVPSRDGVKIPVTLLYAKSHERNGTAPLYQYAYGAYGLSSDPVFVSDCLSLVDRGFVYAIAHVRGGQELGRQWYDSGRLVNKQHSFDDFVDVTRWLIEQRYVDPHRIYASGGSAGGLLIAAVANQASMLYHGLVAHVPFVDVLTSMQDETIPLTTNEYDEWGDPAQAQAYAWIAAYSPLDNVSAKAYPAMLVTAGLWDSQVQYWEPAKWVAKLRAFKTNDEPLLMRMDLKAGHGGKSGRFERLDEVAREYAFLLDLAGIAVAAAP